MQKTEQPIRVLHVFGKLNRGGAESRVMDLYHHMDRSKVQFDFLVHYKAGNEEKRSGKSLEELRPPEDLDEEVRALGGRIYVLPRFTGTNLWEYRKACREFFAAHHDFAAVEGHMTSMASVYLPIAKAAGVPVTIAHARSAGVDAGIRGLATRFFRKSLPKKCDLMMSCSKEASVAVFGKEAYESGRVLAIPNALDLHAFYFDPERRKAARENYAIPDKALVIGHVGRLDPVKNHSYIAKVGRALADRMAENNDTENAAPLYFLFAGKGTLQDVIRKEFETAGLAEHLIFTGQLSREDTAALYQAFDVFVFPSLYEGMPGTVIEAQAAGLPCVISDTITKEAMLTELVCALPLNQEAEWAGEVLRRVSSTGGGCVKQGDPEGRAEASREAARALAEAGYDVESAAVRMQEMYLGFASSSAEAGAASNAAKNSTGEHAGSQGAGRKAPVQNRAE